MLSQLSPSINISNVTLNVVPLCSTYRAPSNKPDFGLLTPILTKFPYFSMLYILLLTCIPVLLAVQASLIINSMLKMANFGINNASEVKSGSFHGALYTEYNSTTFVATSDKRRPFYSSTTITLDKV